MPHCSRRRDRVLNELSAPPGMKAPTSIVRPHIIKENSHAFEPEALPDCPSQRLRLRRRRPGRRAGRRRRQEEDYSAAKEGGKAEKQYGEGHNVELSADTGPRQRLLSAKRTFNRL